MVNGSEIPIHAPKERAVVAFLALAAGRTVRLEEVISVLWGDDPRASARKIVQTYVSTLRRRLPSGLIETDPGGYRLSVAADAVDVAVFERLVREGRSAATRGDAHQAVELFLAAQALWRGDPLSELGDSALAVAHITRLTEMAKAAEEDLVEARLALGEHASIIGELEAAVAAEPLRERRWAQLMMALYRSARQADALRAFQRLRKQLGEELGIEPGPELVALEEAMVLQRPELDWSASELTQQGTFSHSGATTAPIASPIQAAPISLIGRDAELALARQLLAEHRLITMVGAGGAGKTRLAQEVAFRAAELAPEGVCWVGLQSITSNDLVVPAVANALGARGDIVAHIGSRRILVVLDNFEQVIDAAPVVADLLSRTPHLRVLVTSREPLRIAGEHLLPVGPLTEQDAAELFLERARAESPFFDAEPSLGEICQRLDRLPLALELAASLVSLFTLDDLLTRLNRALPILTSQRRDLPERQRTLEATIRWSYNLLDGSQQQVLRRLSPFDSFDLTAASAIDGCSIELVHSLLAKNLVRRIGDDRFQLLQAVREFCLDRLEEQGESEDAHRAMANYVDNLLEDTAGRLHGPAQGASLAQLDAEYGNLRAATQWAVDNDCLAAARIAIGLGWYWLLRNKIGDGVTFLTTVCGCIDELPLRVRAAVQGSYGRLLFYRGEALHSYIETCAARDLLIEAEEAWQQADEEGVLPTLSLRERVATLVYLGITAGSSGDRVLARDAGCEAITVGDATGDPWCIGLAYWGLGTNIFLGRCDPDYDDEARQLLERSVIHLRQAGDSWALGGPLLYLSRQLLASGDTEGAQVTGREALQAFQKAGEKWRIALAFRHLANLAVAQNRESAAVTLGDQADHLERELGHLATVI
jgi:predicted ATPase/DNA-binding SARP family transcriptional activator